MQIVLGVAVLFAMVWFVALRPKPATSEPAAATTAAPKNGILAAPAKARAAVAQSDASTAADGTAANAVDGTPGSGTDTGGAGSTVTHVTAAGASHAAATAPTVKVVVHKGPDARAAHALASHKVLVMLFFNPRGADDRGVRAWFSSISTRKGKVVKIAVPLSRLSLYKSVTDRVQVTESPTVVIFDRTGQPRTLQGYVDPTQVGSRIADALSTKPVADVAPTP